MHDNDDENELTILEKKIQMSLMNRAYFLYHLLTKDKNFFINDNQVHNHNYKIDQFINYGNSIGEKTLKYIGKGFIKFSKWKFEKISSSMRYNYKSSETSS